MLQPDISNKLNLFNQAYLEELFRVQFPSLKVNNIIPFHHAGVTLDPIPGVYYYGLLYSGDVNDTEDENEVIHVKGQSVLHLFTHAYHKHYFTGWKISTDGAVNPTIPNPEPEPPNPDDIEVLELVNAFWVNRGSPLCIVDFPAKLQALTRSEYLSPIGFLVSGAVDDYGGDLVPDNNYCFFTAEAEDQFSMFEIASGTKEITLLPAAPVHQLPFDYLGNARFDFKGANDFSYEVANVNALGDIVSPYEPVPPGTTIEIYPVTLDSVGFSVRFTKILGSRTFTFEMKIKL